MDAAPLDLLTRELATFAPILIANPHCVAAEPGAPCEFCCHWSLPLNPPFIGRRMPNGVAMSYDEWLLWHLHVVGHQLGATRLGS